MISLAKPDPSNRRAVPGIAVHRSCRCKIRGECGNCKDGTGTEGPDMHSHVGRGGRCRSCRFGLCRVAVLAG